MGDRKLYVQPIIIQGSPAAEGATNVFKGPRVGDITFFADPTQDPLSSAQLSYFNPSYTNAIAVPDRTGANTYSPEGWTGFQPIVYDKSGYGHHARVASWRGTTPNLIPKGYISFNAPVDDYSEPGHPSTERKDQPWVIGGSNGTWKIDTSGGANSLFDGNSLHVFN